MSGTRSGLDRRTILAWRNATFAVFTVMGVLIGTWVSRVPAIRDDLGLRLDEMGVLIFAIAAGSVCGLLFASWLIGRFGAPRMILAVTIAGTIGFSVAGVGIAVLGSIPVAFAGFLVFGSAAALTDVSVNVTGAANERALGKAVMPVFHAFFSIGVLAGSGIGAIAELVGLSVAPHFIGIAAISLGSVIVAVRWLVPESAVFADGAEEDAPPRGLRDRLRFLLDPRTLVVGLMVFCAALAEGVANDWIALGVVDGHGFSNAEASVVLVVFVAAMTAARLVSVFLLDRFGRVPILRISFALAFAGLLLFIVAPVPALVYAGAAIWGIGAAIGFPVGMSVAADDPSVAATRVSIVAAIGYLAFLGGPPVIGFLGEHFTILIALTLPLALMVLGFVISGVAREPKAPAAPE